MAAFTVAIEEQIRDWCGDGPTTPELEHRWRLADESVHGAALAVLRRVRRSLVSVAPGEWAVEGDYSQKFTADQLAKLDADVKDLAVLAGDPSAPDTSLRTSFLVRADSCGR